MENKTNIISKQLCRITLIAFQNLKLPHITKYKSLLRKYRLHILVLQHICTYVMTQLLHRTARV